MLLPFQICIKNLEIYVYSCLFMVLIVVFLLFSFQCSGQQIKGQKAIDLNLSKSDIGYMVTGSYVYFFSNEVSLKGGAFYESGTPYQFHYSNYGLQALVRYNLFNISRIIYLTPYIGPTINYDNIRPVKTAYSSSLNFGGILGAEVEAALTESFSFFTYFNQFVLVNKPMGNERCDFGLGVRLYIGNTL